MEHLLYTVALLLIIKNYEVIGYWSTHMEYQPQNSEITASSVLQPFEHFLDPDLFEHHHSLLTSVNPQVLPQSKNPVHPPILMDMSKDDDDDWLSLLHFLIIALKNKKHGYNPYKDGEMLRRFEDNLGCGDGNNCDREKDNAKPNNKDNSSGKSNNNKISSNNENNNEQNKDNASGNHSSCSCGLCQLTKNNFNNGCGCIFVPYPIAVPINIPNGMYGVDLCGTSLGGPNNDTSTTPQTCNCNCNCKDLNEINVIIRSE